MGRVNYGHKLLADSQHKGIRTGVCVDLHFHLHWKQYPLDLQDLSQLDFSKEWQAGAPAFYRYDFQLDQTLDTYLDMTGFGKGLPLSTATTLAASGRSDRPLHFMCLMASSKKEPIA